MYDTVIKKRSVNPWIGNICKSRESRIFGGYYYYLQVRWYDGTKSRNKKFYYDPGDDMSVAEAQGKTRNFRLKLGRDLCINIS